jgi:glutamate racemase
LTGEPKIGVIGTMGTVRSNAYPRKIAARNAACAVFQRATPLFVPLAEEGWVAGEVPEAAAAEYLKSLVDEGIEILLLGCTHYPLLADTIRKTLQRLGSRALVIDSATAMAADVEQVLKEKQLNAHSGEDGQLTCFVTDLPTSFEEVAMRFLGEALEKITQVDIS